MDERPWEPRYKPFGNRPFEELDRRQLEELAAKQRRGPPKIRKVIDALDAAGTDFVSDLRKDVRDELTGQALVLSADVGRAPVWACPVRGPVLDQRLPTFRRGAR